ncbi:YfcE family phosphodiesterase [Patescibacteria group bacterium]|nr:YfcE family phosphodiesterase [Patescibacteria group bacterium]
MKIVIISDIHDNLTNLDLCLAWCKRESIETLICCGDITNAETVSLMAENFSNDIYAVKGNCGLFDDQEITQFKNIQYLGRLGRVNLGGKNIGICHEPFFIEKVRELGECDIIFYGHTHKPWIEEKGRTIEANPGTLGGVFQRATFSFYDTQTGQLELKVLDIL